MMGMAPMKAVVLVDPEFWFSCCKVDDVPLVFYGGAVVKGSAGWIGDPRAITVAMCFEFSPWPGYRRLAAVCLNCSRCPLSWFVAQGGFHIACCFHDVNRNADKRESECRPGPRSLSIGFHIWPRVDTPSHYRQRRDCRKGGSAAGVVCWKRKTRLQNSRAAHESTWPHPSDDDLISLDSPHSSQVYYGYFDPAIPMRRLAVRGSGGRDYSPPILANLVRFPAGSPPDFRKWESCPDDAAGRQVSSGISRFPPLLHSSAAPYLPRFTLIGSQDLDVKSRPNLFTHSANGCRLATSEVGKTRGPITRVGVNVQTSVLLEWRGKKPRSFREIRSNVPSVSRNVMKAAKHHRTKRGR
ncbi:hypothetical protein PR048_001381 [Dryococelus australis]|uniref:Uncharacterized protein n=1 Tax=Dryococelus australis TaxID=614101 RepID=A0ABQ9IH71_9NEOP|nr:hypothetical protein PR048_001381 [Dryococelus australis]